MSKLKDYGPLLMIISIVLAAFAFLAFLIKGALWISTVLMPILNIIFFCVLAFSIVVFLPLALFYKTRGISGIGIFLASYIFGLNLWLFSFLMVYKFWGVVGLVIGLLGAGIGIIPVGFLAILFGHLEYMTDMIFLIICTFGARLLGAWLIGKYEEKQEEVSIAQLSSYLSQEEQEG
jgi:hypothetical protein